MTEDEAKTKWCPFALTGRPWNCRVSPTATAVAVNRLTDAKTEIPRNCCCLGSRCMVWRWGTQDYETFEKPDGTVVYATSEQILNEAKEAGWPPRGYCGFAGYP